MEYVPISEKKNVTDAASLQLREGKASLLSQVKQRESVMSWCGVNPLICVGGPLLYDSVQLVQNSAALNGSQRVLLDHVISEEECADLRHLAHVST